MFLYFMKYVNEIIVLSNLDVIANVYDMSFSLSDKLVDNGSQL